MIPQKSCEVSNLETKSTSDEENPVEESDGELAEKYHQELLKSEENYGVADLNSIRCPPSYLAAKIQDL